MQDRCLYETYVTLWRICSHNDRCSYVRYSLCCSTTSGRSVVRMIWISIHCVHCCALFVNHDAVALFRHGRVAFRARGLWGGTLSANFTLREMELNESSFNGHQPHFSPIWYHAPSPFDSTRWSNWILHLKFIYHVWCNRENWKRSLEQHAEYSNLRLQWHIFVLVLIATETKLVGTKSSNFGRR